VSEYLIKLIFIFLIFCTVMNSESWKNVYGHNVPVGTMLRDYATKKSCYYVVFVMLLRCWTLIQGGYGWRKNWLHWHLTGFDLHQLSIKCAIWSSTFWPIICLKCSYIQMTFCSLSCRWCQKDEICWGIHSISGLEAEMPPSITL
jgi:hypothetical protein